MYNQYLAWKTIRYPEEALKLNQLVCNQIVLESLCILKFTVDFMGRFVNY